MSFIVLNDPTKRQNSTLSYINSLVQLYGASEVWALDDISGTTALAAVSAARNGTYIGVSLNDTDGPVVGESERAGRWDGVNDGCNIDTASYRSIFNSSEGSVFGWVKVAAASVWTDSLFREFFRSFVDINNFIIARKANTNNTAEFYYTAGGVTETLQTAFSSTAWFSWGISWSKPADQVKFYLNGVQVGATATGIGTWVGTPNTNIIGTSSPVTFVSTMNGWLMYNAVRFGNIWTASDFLSMHNEAS